MSDPNSIENTISLQGLQSGDQEEFNKLVEIYSDVMYRLIIKIVKNKKEPRPFMIPTSTIKINLLLFVSQLRFLLKLLQYFWQFVFLSYHAWEWWL